MCLACTKHFVVKVEITFLVVEKPYVQYPKLLSAEVASLESINDTNKDD